MRTVDRVKLTAQLEVLKDVATSYKGKTTDNIIQQIETRLNDACKLQGD